VVEVERQIFPLYNKFSAFFFGALMRCLDIYNHLHCYPSSSVNALYHAKKFIMLPCKLLAFVYPAVAVTCLDMARVFKEEGNLEIDRGG
jgi:hypothetical protein